MEVAVPVGVDAKALFPSVVERHFPHHKLDILVVGKGPAVVPHERQKAESTGGSAMYDLFLTFVPILEQVIF